MKKLIFSIEIVAALFSLIILSSISFAEICTSPYCEAVPSSFATQQSFSLDEVKDIEKYLTLILNNVNMSNIRMHIEYLSGLGSRMSGYPGFYKAADYIEEKFKEFGMDRVYRDTYYQVVPIDYGASLEVLEPTHTSFTIYPLLPNVVVPPTLPKEGLVGRLVYVGSCNLKELNGKPLNGSILLADFNSFQDWVVPLLFGAKAVIFIEPDYTNSLQAQLKTLSVPANIPRFYIRKADALQLLKLGADKGEVVVKLTSIMKWENKPLYNIIGIINGTEYPNQIIQVWAYYDSYSVVPSLAPGADQATGIAVMLEMARFFSKYRPARTIMFVALSGHWQCVAGARYHVWKYFWSGGAKDVGLRTILTMGLDLSTDSEYMAFYFGAAPAGYPSLYGVDRHDWYDIQEALKPIFYWGRSDESTLREWKSKGLICENINDGSLIYYMVKNTGRKYLVSDGMSGMGYGSQGYPANLYAVPISQLYLDTEPAAMAGAVAFSLRTSLAFRGLWGTPLDTLERVDFEKLRPQAEVAFATVFLYANLRGLESVVPKPKLYWDPVQARGFSVARIRVVRYDYLTGTYKPVSNVIVIAQLSTGTGHTTFSGTGHVMYGITDENGTLIIYGFRGAHGGTELRYIISAYGVDPESGNLVYAPDFGRYGARIFDPKVFPDKEEKDYTVAVFECGTVVLLGALDIRDLTFEKINFAVYEVGSHAETLNFGATGGVIAVTAPRPWEAGAAGGASGVSSAVHVVFVPPNRNVEILVYSGPELVGVLNNGGKGFNVGRGEQIIVSMPFAMTSDLCSLNNYRLSIANSYYLFSGGMRAESFHNWALNNMSTALKYIEEKNYEKAYSSILFAWSNAYTAYLETKKLYYESIQSYVVFILLLSAFVLFFERLLNLKGYASAIVIVALSGALLALMYFVHPGMRLASNPFMVAFSGVVLVLLIPLIFIVFSETKFHIESEQKRLVGEHYAKLSKAAAVFLALSTAPSNLRKRPLRSGLTVFTVATITAALVTCTSAYFYTGMRELPGAQPPYLGILLYKRGWSAMPIESVRLLKATVSGSGTVAASGFIAPSWAGPTQTDVVRVKGKYCNATYRAIWGLDPEAGEIYGFEKVLVAGRWLLPTDVWAAVVSDDIYAAGVELGDTIVVMGNEFTVVGVVSRIALSAIRDLNGQGIVPIDYVKESQKVRGGGISEKPERLEGQYIIIPFITFRMLGGSAITISAKISEESVVRRLAGALTEMLSTDVYAGLPEGVIVFRKAVAFAWLGLATVLIPLVIGGLMLLNTMLTSLYERSREIRVLSSVGVSPTQISLLFLTETLTIALIGTVVGYIAGLTAIHWLLRTGELPFGIVNYSSYFVVLSLLLSIAMTASSAAYPAVVAARALTPSLERRYKITKPRGDLWEIPMPFTIAGDEELKGFINYLYEFLNAYRMERMGAFMIRNLTVKEEVVRGEKLLSLSAIVHLSPYEQGIVQEATLRARYDAASRKYLFLLVLKRLEGIYTLWVQNNRPFIDAVRKQFLVWKGLSAEEKKRYIGKPLEAVRGG